MMKPIGYYDKAIASIPKVKLYACYTIMVNDDIIIRDYVFSNTELESWVEEGYIVETNWKPVNFDAMIDNRIQSKKISDEIQYDILQANNLTNHPLAESYYGAAARLRYVGPPNYCDSYIIQQLNAVALIKQDMLLYEFITDFNNVESVAKLKKILDSLYQAEYW